MIRTLAVVPALLVACTAAAPRPAVKLPPLAGKPLDAAALDPSGREVRIEPSGRVLVVDFFASWCQPCRAQLPRLDRLARDLGDRGVSVYAVSFDEDREALLGFTREVPVGFPVLWDRGGERLAGPLRIERLPTTLVVDAAGTIREVHVGYDLREGDLLEAEVRALLGGVTSAAPP
ncbi:MAG TPA: TlpA disulfide reductase family protein [Anaeromyxobacter sp.]|nr:TlpA disulfide reductase family protein [Anaeromyxobacter sp.]